MEPGVIPGPSPPAAGPTDFADLRKRVTELKARLDFTAARTALDRARAAYLAANDTDPERERQFTWIVQQRALCTYKDENLHPITRLDQALALLEEIGLGESSNPETLGLAGAVFKRKFEQTGQLDDLCQALGYYRAAWERAPESDLGYGGINAAFVLDMLAARADLIARAPEVLDPAACRAEARRLRTEIAQRLAGWCGQNPALYRTFFAVATLAEARFGLAEYAEAGELLARARAIEPGEWEQQTLVRQLVALGRLQGVQLPRDGDPPSRWEPAWQALARFLGDNTERALGCFRGKIGLALSGGGFRASFFHIGVLARLAEIDALRSVEVLSTVSGGSILGAYYYLSLRHLLQVKPDREISRSDYIALVDDLRREFFNGVRKNIRMRTFSSPIANLRMLGTWPPGKARTVRLGELYEHCLYARVRDENAGTRGRPMRELLIAPKDEGGYGVDFNPKFSNWRRRAKVPILLINATSLNTAHSWHFTAKGMGEPPALVGEEVDLKPRYRRPYYEQIARPALRDVSLGRAVAASSCVPGLFAPIELRGLYPDRTVRLVDGGVHDNQGVQALLVEGCNVVLCSDGSGQLGEERDVSARELPVVLRANNSLMERLREAQYQTLRSKHDGRALAGLFFVHLKKGLEAAPVDWIGADPPTAAARLADRTTYGVARDLQAKIAAIRTDLDAFSEVEASALMLSGYLMAEHEWKTALREWGTVNGFDVDAERGAWDFLLLEPVMGRPAGDGDPRREDLARQLDAASRRFFKLWRLSPAVPGLAWVTLFLATALLVYGVLDLWGQPVVLPHLILTWSALGRLGAVLVAAVLAAVAAFTLAVMAHLAVVNPLYLARGRLGDLLQRRR